MMLGGVIGGDCAPGRFTTGTAPASVMTIESTAAKMGRSIKKCENIFPAFSGRRNASTQSRLHFSFFSFNKRTSGISGAAGGGCTSTSTAFEFRLIGQSDHHRQFRFLRSSRLPRRPGREKVEVSSLIHVEISVHWVFRHDRCQYSVVRIDQVARIHKATAHATCDWRNY